MPNRSLDDFAGGGTDEEAAEDETADAEAADAETADTEAADAETVDAEIVDAETADAETADAETADAEATVEASDPDVETLATYRWTPSGTTCPQCGTSAEKTWLDGEEYVCADCKNW
ncbi:hypothetical protein [Haloferax sp. YSMS24]|uniref:DUF7573 domain-containing protein n=1 Tax=Haloferax sp. YSMS24 TaxID=3388425 RepID=UPI00398C9F6D